MRRAIFIFLTTFVACFSFSCLHAQERTLGLINEYGSFDNWSVREVKESSILGGNVKHLYEFYGDMDTVRTKEPFSAPADYLWRTNNVLAVIAGVTKTNTTVFPEKRGSGYCARLETHIESVKALGLINMDVTCQGALFIGVLAEPIRDTRDPMSKVLYGIPYSGRPYSVIFDYKAEVGHEVVRGTGFSPLKELGYADYPQATILLQKRWEEPDGSVHALRVGTAIKRFMVNEPSWVNGFEMVIHYGDITGEPFFEDYMGLNNSPEKAFHCINGKGDNVVVHEDGWAPAGTEPNYLIVNFLSSSDQAFYGGVGNILWIDNFSIRQDGPDIQVNIP